MWLRRNGLFWDDETICGMVGLRLSQYTGGAPALLVLPANDSGNQYVISEAPKSRFELSKNEIAIDITYGDDELRFVVDNKLGSITRETCFCARHYMIVHLNKTEINKYIWE